MELEFQVWNHESKRMDDVHRLDFINNGYWVQTGQCSDCGFWVFPPEEFTLRQYTGLKDKNGKKIFNGDIVNSFYGKGVVTYIQGNGWFIKTSEDIKKWYDTYEEAQHRLSWNEVEKLEIIGNIYEHSHLIN